MVRVFDKNTLSPARSFERRFESALTRGEYPCADVYPREEFAGAEFVYFGELVKASGRLDGLALSAEPSTGAAKLLGRVLEELGADTRSPGVVFTVGADGQSLSVREGELYIDGTWRIGALAELAMLKAGADEFALPFLSPHALQRLAEANGARVRRYLTRSLSDTDEDELAARALAAKQPCFKDACFAAVAICGALRSGTSLHELCAELPEFCYAERTVDADQRAISALMRTLTNQTDGGGGACGCGSCVSEAAGNRRSAEGARLNYPGGFVRVVPNRSGFRLLCDAADSEAAAEMLTAADLRIRGLLSEMRAE
jgi:hypothetical protein